MIVSIGTREPVILIEPSSHWVSGAWIDASSLIIMASLYRIHSGGCESGSARFGRAPAPTNRFAETKKTIRLTERAGVNHDSPFNLRIGEAGKSIGFQDSKANRR